MRRVKIANVSVDKKLKARRSLEYRLEKTAHAGLRPSYTKSGPGRYHVQGKKKLNLIIEDVVTV